MTQTLRLEIQNEKGLHARASAEFAKLVGQFDADAAVGHEGMIVSGESIMGLLMLAASQGCFIDVQTSGAQSAELAAAIEALVNGKFHEGK